MRTTGKDRGRHRNAAPEGEQALRSHRGRRERKCVLSLCACMDEWLISVWKWDTEGQRMPSIWTCCTWLTSYSDRPQTGDEASAIIYAESLHGFDHWVCLISCDCVSWQQMIHLAFANRTRCWGRTQKQTHTHFEWPHTCSDCHKPHTEPSNTRSSCLCVIKNA